MKEELMADCPICSKENTMVEHTHLIYTAFQHQTKIKTGFKQYQITTRTFGAQKHAFKVCDACEVKYNRIIPGLIWAAGIILALLAYIYVKHDDQMLVLMCICPIPLVIAFSLNKEFFSLNAKLKKVAIAERGGNHGGDFSVVAYTKAEYEKLLRKNKR